MTDFFPFAVNNRLLSDLVSTARNPQDFESNHRMHLPNQPSSLYPYGHRSAASASAGNMGISGSNNNSGNSVASSQFRSSNHHHRNLLTGGVSAPSSLPLIASRHVSGGNELPASVVTAATASNSVVASAYAPHGYVVGTAASTAPASSFYSSHVKPSTSKNTSQGPGTESVSGSSSNVGVNVQQNTIAASH